MECFPISISRPVGSYIYVFNQATKQLNAAKMVKCCGIALAIPASNV